MRGMHKNGFVTSALLYGILSLFLVLILGTVSVLGNRKLATDKIKSSALDDVQDLTTPSSCFEFKDVTVQVWKTESDDENAGETVLQQVKIITDYHDDCDKTVFIPEYREGLSVYGIGSGAFKNKNLKNVTIKDNIKIICDDGDNTSSQDANIINNVKTICGDSSVGAFSGNKEMIFFMKMKETDLADAPWGATDATVHWD